MAWRLTLACVYQIACNVVERGGLAPRVWGRQQVAEMPRAGDAAAETHDAT